MTDRIQPEVRSCIMRRVRTKDTKPEKVVRRLVHGLGYRYRLHARNLQEPRILYFLRGRRPSLFTAVSGIDTIANEGNALHLTGVLERKA